MNYISKKLITVTAMIAVISACSSGDDHFKNAHFGDVIEYHKGETYSAKLLNEKFIDVLNGNLGSNGFKKDDPGYKINIDNLSSQFLNKDQEFVLANYDVQAYSITYNTLGVNYKNDAKDFKHKVSGLLLVPKISQDKIKGIVLYYHGTESVKNSIPSCTPNSDFTKASASNFNYCNVNDENFNRSYIAKLGASLAGQGYIVFAPDYIGLGADYKSMHPYVVYPTINAITGIYGLQAVNQVLHKENIVSENYNYKLFTGGYSEGGAYAMETSRIVQFDYDNLSLKNLLIKNHISLIASAPAEGAYSLSEAQMDFDFEDLKDGFINKNIPAGMSPEEFAHSYKDNLLDCSNLEGKDEISEKCAGGTDYQKENNTWHIGSSFEAAIAKPYIVSYAMVAYAYYSLHNLVAGYDQLMPREFWSNIPILDKNYNLSGKSLNLVQFFMDPSIKNSDTMSLILHTTKQKYNNKFYNQSDDIYLNLYNFGYTELPDKTKVYSDSTNYETVKVMAEAMRGIDIRFPQKISTEDLKGFGLGQNNSAGAFVHDKIKNLPLFKKSMQDGDTYRWNTMSPIYLIHADYDSVVPNKHSDIAYNYMHNLSPDYVKKISLHNFQMSNHDHNLILMYNPFSDYMAPLPLTKELIDNAISGYCKSDSKKTPEEIKACIEENSKMMKDFLPLIGMPIDHTQAEPFTIVGTLCAFEQEGKQPNSICKPIK